MTESESKDTLWDAGDVAQYLRVSEGTVAQWTKAGRIPVVKVGSLNRYRPADIYAWVDSQTRPASVNTH